MKRVLVTLLVVLSALALGQFSPNAIIPVSAATCPPTCITSVTLTGPANYAALTSTYITLSGKVVTSPTTVEKDVQVTFSVNGAPVCGTSGAHNATATGTFSCNYAVEASGTYTWSATAEGCLGPSCVAPYSPTPSGNMTTVTSSLFTFYANPIVYQIPLVSGWNLISLPLIPASTAIGNVLASQIAGANFSVVWSYQAGKWISATLSSGKLTGALTTMADGHGYWIYMTRADNLFVLGSDFAPPPSTPPSYPLSLGWNLVGFTPEPSIGSETLTGATGYLAGLGSNYDSAHVYIYVNSSESWEVSPSTVYPGQGMWVFVTATPATLTP